MIWVQADRTEAERRGLERDVASGTHGDRSATVAFWNMWSEAERRYLSGDRPWERADLIVAGTPPRPMRAGMVAVAEGPL